MLQQAEEELGSGVLPADGAEADEAGEEGDDLVAGKTGETDYLVQRQTTLKFQSRQAFGGFLKTVGGLLKAVSYALHDGEQVADVVVVGEHGALGLLRFAPEGKVDGRGQDVLVVDTDVGTWAA